MLDETLGEKILDGRGGPCALPVPIVGASSPPLSASLAPRALSRARGGPWGPAGNSLAAAEPAALAAKAWQAKAWPAKLLQLVVQYNLYCLVPAKSAVTSDLGQKEPNPRELGSNNSRPCACLRALS